MSPSRIAALGIRAGRDVQISEDARLFGGERIVIGDNVRIDAFCVISAGATGHVRFGSHIHVASGVRIFGDGTVSLGDFSSVSAGSTLYSASDDYSGEHLMGPTISTAFTSVDKRPIELRELAAVGAHAVLLPGVVMAEGSVLGTMSLARDSLEPWTVYAGVPCRPIRARSRTALQMAERFRTTEERGTT